MYGSTPSGRSRSYSYYITHAKPEGWKINIPSEIDPQIPEWLQGITVNPSLVPEIREVYRNQVGQLTNIDREERKTELYRRLSKLREEETRLGRLLITGKMSEAAYDQLRAEWQEKVLHTEASLRAIEQDITRHLNDLDMALILLTKASELYHRLEDKKCTLLLQILAKHIIINAEGKIIDQELHSPFTYL